MTKRILTLAVLAWLLTPCSAKSQDLPLPATPHVDTIIVHTENVFGPNEASRSVLFSAANSIHVTTRHAVVRRELLFDVGVPYDSALVAETERNLRRLGIFRYVSIDSTRIGEKLAVIVTTADGWTTQLLTSAYRTGGDFSWLLGVAELNLLGTATRASASYRNEPDRSAVTFGLGMDRSFGSAVAVGVVYDDLSDGEVGGWTVGIPWRAMTDRHSFELSGRTGTERVLRYREGELADSVERRSFLQRASYARALRASAAGYVRVGVAGQVYRAEHVAYPEVGSVVPDTVKGVVGLFGEASRARYKVVTHYNGFARDFDIDLSTRVSVSAWLAPEGFGYDETGVGGDIDAQAGVPIGRGFAVIRARANALWNSIGIDSGQAWVGITVAAMPVQRNATVFHLQMGAQRGVPFGAEYDIGHGFGPRAFKSHSFTGNRMIWGSLEHRAFLVDEVFGMLGVGFAAFFDYGGAWFENNARRFGGDVGVGLRLGATRANGPNVGRLDFSYRFGDGSGGGGWVVSFGRGFAF